MLYLFFVVFCFIVLIDKATTCHRAREMLVLYKDYSTQPYYYQICGNKLCKRRQ